MFQLATGEENLIELDLHGGCNKVLETGHR